LQVKSVAGIVIMVITCLHRW